MAREKVAVIDGGGRGSVLVDKYLQSEHVASVIAIPGNDMMKLRREKPVETVPVLKTTDVEQIVKICKERGITFVDVAQDNAIQVGLVNSLQKEGITTLGPRKLAGQIEWSKAFAREFGVRHGLPQPEFRVCYSEGTGIAYVRGESNRPKFIKADGLYEGKGSLPAENMSRAVERIGEVRKFKDGAGCPYIVEEWMKNDDGTDCEEFSAFAISDGQTYRILGNAQDHKRVGNFDVGENTGGTGCSTPPLVLTKDIQKEVEIIFGRTINGLSLENKPYKGVLYLGGMLVRKQNGNKVYVVEFNSRWGDPEAQVIVPGIKNDIFELGMQAVDGNIKDLKVETDNKARVVVAGMSRGYPGNYDSVKGKRIFGLEEATKMDGVKVYGAGTKVIDGKYYAAGGRLFYVMGEGTDVIEARERAYSAMSKIFIEGNNLHYRTDIGWRDADRALIRK